MTDQIPMSPAGSTGRYNATDCALVSRNICIQLGGNAVVH